MSWFKKLLPSKIRTQPGAQRKGVPEGLWTKCKGCEAVLYSTELERNLYVCPKCNYHDHIPAHVRLMKLLDENSGVRLGEEVRASDKLRFKDLKKYTDRISAAEKASNETESLVVMEGQIKALPLVVAVFEYGFLSGTMGTALGDRFVIAVHRALERKIPLVCFSASGGARMQEALFSLMQMAKVSAALAKLSEAGLPFISVLTNPTTGGVSASLAMLGDIIIAEPQALIGFAGPRVIEQTVRVKLPEGFQRSEFLLEHGAIDMIVNRADMRDALARTLAKLLHHASV